MTASREKERLESVIKQYISKTNHNLRNSISDTALKELVSKAINADADGDARRAAAAVAAITAGVPIATLAFTGMLAFMALIVYPPLISIYKLLPAFLNSIDPTVAIAILATLVTTAVLGVLFTYIFTRAHVTNHLNDHAKTLSSSSLKKLLFTEDKTTQQNTTSKAQSNEAEPGDKTGQGDEKEQQGDEKEQQGDEEEQGGLQL